MSPESATGELRAVLDAPRGRRFSRPGLSNRPMAAPPSDSESSHSGFSKVQFKAREQRLLAQMKDNPRVAHRQTHGVLPQWVYAHVARIDEREHERRIHPASDHPERPEVPWKPAPPPTPRHRPRPTVPRPRPAPDDGPPPPRPPRPPLPRRPRRPHSHRKPRRSRAGWHLCVYTLAALIGAVAHRLVMGLL